MARLQRQTLFASYGINGKRTSKAGGPVEGNLLVCLDRGKEFAYDWALMKVILKQNQASEPAAEPAPVKANAA